MAAETQPWIYQLPPVRPYLLVGEMEVVPPTPKRAGERPKAKAQIALSPVLGSEDMYNTRPLLSRGLWLPPWAHGHTCGHVHLDPC